jgi:hypothetical protein
MATKGYKTTLNFGDQATAAASTTWTPLAKVTDITPPKVSVDDIETSNMDSPVDDNDVPWKEFESGWAEAGEVDVTIQFDKNQADSVYGMVGVSKGWKIAFRDGSTWALDGYIKTYGDEVEREKLVTTKATIKISGRPLFTKAA